MGKNEKLLFEGLMIIDSYNLKTKNLNTNINSISYNYSI